MKLNKNINKTNLSDEQLNMVFGGNSSSSHLLENDMALLCNPNSSPLFRVHVPHKPPKTKTKLN